MENEKHWQDWPVIDVTYDDRANPYAQAEIDGLKVGNVAALELHLSRRTTDGLLTVFVATGNGDIERDFVKLEVTRLTMRGVLSPEDRDKLITRKPS